MSDAKDPAGQAGNSNLVGGLRMQQPSQSNTAEFDQLLRNQHPQQTGMQHKELDDFEMMLGSSHPTVQPGQMISMPEEPRMLPANSLMNGFGASYPGGVGGGETGTTPRNDPFGGLMMNR